MCVHMCVCGCVCVSTRWLALEFIFLIILLFLFHFKIYVSCHQLLCGRKSKTSYAPSDFMKHANCTQGMTMAMTFAYPFAFQWLRLIRWLGAWVDAALNLGEIVSHYDEHLWESWALAHKFTRLHVNHSRAASLVCAGGYTCQDLN